MSTYQRIQNYSRCMMMALCMGFIGSHMVWAADDGPQAVEHMSDDWTVGEIRKIDKSAGKLTILHENIKSLNMPAMTMVFGVKNKDQLVDLKVGDKVQFKAVQEQGKLIVTDIQAVNVGAARSGPTSDKDGMQHGRKMKETTEMMVRMEKHIEHMRVMVQKWDAAQTPEARQALMEEHHSMMHEGMEMSPNKGDHKHH
jgi:Cu/Ag efflux protein CusF